MARMEVVVVVHEKNGGLVDCLVDVLLLDVDDV